MKIIHGDHGLTEAHWAEVAATIDDIEPQGFFIATTPITNLCPMGLKCALRGPSVGDEPIGSDQVYMATRGDRKGPSRMTLLPPLEADSIVIIGNVEGDEVTIYTAYGTVGRAVAPKEPWDYPEGTSMWAESRAFWAEHALSDN